MSEPTCHRPSPEDAFQAAIRSLQQLVAERLQIRNAQELQAVEQQIVAATDQLASAILAVKLQGALGDPALQAEARMLVKQAPKKLKSQGQREVTVQGTRGPAFTLRTAYYSPNTKQSRKKK